MSQLIIRKKHYTYYHTLIRALLLELGMVILIITYNMTSSADGLIMPTVVLFWIITAMVFVALIGKPRSVCIFTDTGRIIINYLIGRNIIDKWDIKSYCILNVRSGFTADKTVHLGIEIQLNDRALKVHTFEKNALEPLRYALDKWNIEQTVEKEEVFFKRKRL